MTTAMDVHFVRNNPFILNDSHFGRSPPSLPTSASSTHVPLQRRTPVQVSQSASCSNIQRTIVRSRFEDPSALPPAPHSIYRRFQLLEQTSMPSSPRPPTNTTVKAAPIVEVSEMKLCSKHRSRSLGPLDVNSNNVVVSVDTSSDEEGSIASHIEYGPGIVQKLREKFSKLATTAIETAQISPHARQKKFPSVDDILSESEQRGFVEEKQRENHYHAHAISTSVPPAPKKAILPPAFTQPPPQPQNEFEACDTTDEESVAAVAPPLPEKRIESPRSVVEEAPIEKISALRAKFEQQSRATTPSIRGGPASLNFVKKSASRDDVILYSTLSAPPHTNIEEHAELSSPPRPPKQIYSSKSEFMKGPAPKPVRVLDLVSPPADPAPKGIQNTTYSRGISPTSSVADSDRSPPPEEPKFKQFDDDDEEYDVDSDDTEGNAKLYDLVDAQDKFSMQHSRDERFDERAHFQAQKSKMTLTLPIGNTEVPVSKQLPTPDVRIGKPGNTPITASGKLKIAPNVPTESSEGFSEVQRLLNKFSTMREQKVTTESDSMDPNVSKSASVTFLPTAIVPPVQTSTPNRFSWNSAPVTTIHSRQDSDESQWSSRHNIVSITVGDHEQRQDFLEDVDDSNSTSSQSKLRSTVAPPPLPPRGGTEQQQAQRKSLTQRWLESKHGGSASQLSDGSSDDSDADSTLDRRHLESSYGVTTGVGGHSKPYGDDEIIESDSGHRRSIDLTGIQEETEEDMAQEAPAVRLLSRRSIEDDGGSVSRSDFLKGTPPYDSSESDEDEYQQHHQMSYRMGFYDRTTASDGNPVRHSLLNLVEEEDIPELLQAMAEECHFVFDDCDDNRPTTSGIIHAPAKRVERRKARNVDRIRFEEVPPSVFAYVDENTAYEDGEWSDGCRISYDDYRNIVDAAQEEAAQQQMDLANWRHAMEQKYAAEAAEREATGGMIAQVVAPRPSDADLGVTSTFSYATPPSTAPPASVATMLGLRPTTTS